MSLPDEGCIHRDLPEGIHEIILQTPTADSLAQCFIYLSDRFAEAPIDQPFLLISDIRTSGVPPLHLLWNFALKLFSNRRQYPPICDAILHMGDTPYPVFRLVVEQLASLYKVKVRFFGEDRDQAIAWLLEQNTKTQQL